MYHSSTGQLIFRTSITGVSWVWPGSKRLCQFFSDGRVLRRELLTTVLQRLRERERCWRLAKAIVSSPPLLIIYDGAPPPAPSRSRPSRGGEEEDEEDDDEDGWWGEGLRRASWSLQQHFTNGGRPNDRFRPHNVSWLWRGRHRSWRWRQRHLRPAESHQHSVTAWRAQQWLNARATSYVHLPCQGLPWASWPCHQGLKFTLSSPCYALS